jgi:hypothetical protein
VIVRVLRWIVVRILGNPPDPAWDRLKQTPVNRTGPYDAAQAARGVMRARDRAGRVRRAPRARPGGSHGELE